MEVRWQTLGARVARATLKHRSTLGLLRPDVVILNEEQKKAFLRVEGKGFRVCCDGFIVGSLGTWDPENDHLHREIGISRKYGTLFKKLCCRDAISGSYGVWTARSSLHAGRASS